MEVRELLALLRSKYAIRRFYMAFLSGLVLLGLAKFVIVDPLTGSATHTVSGGAKVLEFLVDEGTAAVIFSLILVSFFLWVTPRTMAKSQISAISPHEIREALLKGASSASEYWFRGRSGRFLRSSVLPLIARRASEDLHAKTVYILVPDPRATTALQVYADYRNSIGIANDIQWTPSHIRNEIIATIITAARLYSSNTLINIQLGLLSTFSSLRFDMSSDFVIITREDPKWPALKCDSDSVFYNLFREEMRTSFEQSNRIVLDRNAFRNVPLAPENVQRFLVSAGLNGIDLTPDDLSQIMSAIERPHDPYGRTHR